MIMDAKGIIAGWKAQAAAWRIEVRGLTETQRYFEKVMRDLQGPPLVQKMVQAVTWLERDAKKLAPVYTGRLRASIVPRVTVMPLGTSGVEVIGTVGSNVQYAATMEFGGPLTSSFDEIMRWVHLKRIAGVYSIKSHRRLGSAQRQVDEDRATTIRIYRSMTKKGVQAHPFLIPAIEKNAYRLWRLFGDFVAKVIAQ